MEMKFYLVFVTALIPLLVGFVWYNPKVFGNAWMKACGLTEEDIQGANMLVIFGLAYVFGILLSFAVAGLAIHAFGIYGLAGGDFSTLDPEMAADFQAFASKYAGLHRDFGHGALHGGFAAITLALPILATNALFERKNWKYILINVGYWFVTMMLIGGVLCEYM